ncbi:MAG: thioredoxin family protein [Thermoplasmatales archaeon]|nr:thioredoxin family protein [Thermoplasmatales archaeon]
MAWIKEEDQKYLKQEFEKYLKDDVDLNLFVSRNDDCKYCKETEELLNELVVIDKRLHLNVYDYNNSPKEVKEYSVEKYPATIISRHGIVDGRIKYYGMPSGYEFGSLIEDIKNVSKWEVEVSSKALTLLKEVKKPITIKVYVTPTCPYCPKAVGTAHKFSIVNENITSEMIEALEFEEEAEEVGVSSVPHITINGTVQFVGAQPDDNFAEYVSEANSS